ncbi:GMP/IMP nucleotidase [Congregibacter sp.]|uniref:GMP/IMP nucleotidase n=1 Tax=Congregibacter sp. TaxID=2744308 RepID=UPI00385DCE15
MDWPNIRPVLLDMDGTLLDLHYDNHFWMEYLPRAYAQERGIAEDEAIAQIHSGFASVRGSLPWYCLDHWSRELGMDIPSLKRELKHMIRVRPYSLEFLRWLRSQPVDVLLVTNAHRETLNIKMAEVDITEWFDHIVVSHDLDAPKEHQVFWERLQKLHPFDPKTTLFIDDTESVLDAAKTYGIRHLLTLLQPDSSQQKRIDTRFPGIHHFDEIMPSSLP